jgi:hypothetical protein
MDLEECMDKHNNNRTIKEGIANEGLLWKPSLVKRNIFWGRT